MRTKTKWGLAVAVVLAWGGCGASRAADLSAGIPTKAPAAAPRLIDCYVGGHVGAVVSEDTFGNFGFSSAAPVVGGQAGCDYAFAPAWIVGVEGRAAWSSLSYTHASAVVFPPLGRTVPSHISFSNDFLASATARLGYRFAGQWLLFASGGAAWTRERGDDAFVSLTGVAVDPTASATRTGWTAGAGLEYAIAPHWSAVIDYRYYDFGSHTAVLTSSNNPTTVTTGSLKDTIHESSVGVNYHF